MKFFVPPANKAIMVTPKLYKSVWAEAYPSWASRDINNIVPATFVLATDCGLMIANPKSTRIYLLYVVLNIIFEGFMSLWNTFCEWSSFKIFKRSTKKLIHCSSPNGLLWESISAFDPGTNSCTIQRVWIPSFS